MGTTEDCDIAVGGRARLSALLVDYGAAIAHQLADTTGQGLRARGFVAAVKAPQFHGRFLDEIVPGGYQGNLFGFECIGERWQKEVVDVVHQRRGGAPGLFQYLWGIAGFSHAIDHCGHQHWVRAAEAVDGLFDIAHPDHLPGQLREFQEQRQLYRAGVLELVHHQQL